MFRGTTPIIKFSFPFDFTNVNKIYITFAQNKKIVLEKDISAISFLNSTISLPLSQVETLLFSDMAKIEMQIRFTTLDGMSVASDIICTTVSEILKDGEI
ncbi:MAG: hypothetical protein RR205_05275 [Oscillospiraceae bacterium]